MKYEEIQVLIDKYFEGETSIEEERALKKYFSSGTADERFRPLLPLFDFIREEQSVRIRQEPVVVHAPNRFGWKAMRIAATVTLLLAAFAWWRYQPGIDTPQPVASVQPVAPAPVIHENEAPPSVKQEEAPVKRAAAPQNRKPKARFAHHKQVDTFQKPEEAAQEIKAALELISSKLRKGQKEATKNIHAIEALDKIIKKPADS